MNTRARHGLDTVGSKTMINVVYFNLVKKLLLVNWCHNWGSSCLVVIWVTLFGHSLQTLLLGKKSFFVYYSNISSY